MNVVDTASCQQNRTVSVGPRAGESDLLLHDLQTPRRVHRTPLPTVGRPS